MFVFFLTMTLYFIWTPSPALAIISLLVHISVQTVLPQPTLARCLWVPSSGPNAVVYTVFREDAQLGSKASGAPRGTAYFPILPYFFPVTDVRPAL